MRKTATRKRGVRTPGPLSKKRWQFAIPNEGKVGYIKEISTSITKKLDSP